MTSKQEVLYLSWAKSLHLNYKNVQVPINVGIRKHSKDDSFFGIMLFIVILLRKVTEKGYWNPMIKPFQMTIEFNKVSEWPVESIEARVTVES